MFGGLRSHLKKRQRQEHAEAAGESTAFKSLVWLLKEPRDINRDTLLILARKALKDDLMDVVEAPADPELSGQMFLVTTNSGSGFAVISAHKPYADDPAATTEDVDEQRRRHLFAEHKAWLAVDIIKGEDSPKTFEIMGKLMAELSGPDCLMLYSTTEQILHPWHVELANALRSPDPMGALRSKR